MSLLSDDDDLLSAGSLLPVLRPAVRGRDPEHRAGGGGVLGAGRPAVPGVEAAAAVWVQVLVCSVCCFFLFFFLLFLSVPPSLPLQDRLLSRPPLQVPGGGGCQPTPAEHAAHHGNLQEPPAGQPALFSFPC